MLKTEWAFAICLGKSVDVIAISPAKLAMKGKNSNTPIMLITICVKDSLLEERDDPRAASIPVMHDPILAPRMIAMAASKLIKSFIPRDITNPIKAVLLLKILVTITPPSNPDRGNCPRLYRKSFRAGSS
jgi:hypothetical protein